MAINEIATAGGAVAVGGSVTDNRRIDLHYPTLSDAQQYRNRERMLARVRTTWITGVLEPSLQATPHIVLGLRMEPEAVANPWQPVLEPGQLPVPPLPAGTAITQVYDASDGSLLILGAPGAGKTTLLLQLARTCLDRADRDATAPIPVVFHLASWAEKRAPLASWLVDELLDKYQVPRAVGHAWVRQDQLRLLLDGLDEVDAAHREACVQAITGYRQEHGLVPLVVCSREAEYHALPTRLPLGSAVSVQPLTGGQVAAYLAADDTALAQVAALLDADSDLAGLLDTPLMLNVVAHAYQGRAAPPLQPGAIPTTQPQILAAYVARMLARRPTTTPYSAPATAHWLTWLARQLVEHHQVIFYIEHLQPDWLPPSAQWWYRGFIGLTGGVIGAATLGLAGGVGGVISGRWVEGLVTGVGGGVICGLIWGFGAGLGAGYGRGIASKPGGDYAAEYHAGPVSRLDRIRPTEVVVWSGMLMRQWMGKYLPTSIVWGVGGGLLGALLGGVGGGLLSALLVLALFEFAVGIYGGLSMGTLAEDKRMRPNQGMWQSARNGLLFAGVYGVLGAVTGALIGGLGLGPVAAVDLGLLFGLVNGISSGLIGGWAACIQHLTLRLLLWRSGAVPGNYVRFLDEATERILLRKVGGGYIFVHRLLLEYFAGLEAPGDEHRPT
jgi:hypothetical protein